jgi:hypothetical protein
MRAAIVKDESKRPILFLLVLSSIMAWGGLPAEGRAASMEGRDRPAPDLSEAVRYAHEEVPFVREVLDEYPGVRRQKLIEMGIGVQDLTRTCFWLDSPCIKKLGDEYEPVRFMHGTHAALLKDCSECHHARPADPTAGETVRCAACHQEPFQENLPERIGLKAAYHLKCAGCHKKENKGPVSCTGCHLSRVPDHRDLLDLPDGPEPMEVTRECLSCHEQAGEDLLTSAHWLWQGPSPYTFRHRKDTVLGKRYNTLNSF